MECRGFAVDAEWVTAVVAGWLGGWNSVPERGFWCTEYAFGAKKGLLVYATRFLRHSVLKTGFSCTEEKFGAKNRLLVYGASSSFRGALHRKQPSGVWSDLQGYSVIETPSWCAK